MALIQLPEGSWVDPARVISVHCAKDGMVYVAIDSPNEQFAVEFAWQAGLDAKHQRDMIAAQINRALYKGGEC